jgi:alpha-tubulin suppressor-like RCC1 family protein
LLAACSERPDFTPGTECELNTECAAPLVCRLGRCRVECRARRDCAAGLECVRDDRGLGVCQLPEETECERNSDCPDPLVCRFGSCTNACVDDRDCISGARCVAGPEGGRACRDQAEEQCERNSDCPVPYICAADEHCREECREDRDCRDGNVCLVGMDPPVCGPPTMRPDGGLGPDGGGDMDAGLGDDGGTPADGGAPTDGSSGGGGPVTPPPPPLMAGGEGHTCTQTTTPAGLHCFGSDMYGQIGDGTAGMPPSPTPYLLSIADVRVVGAGGSHSCVATPTQLFCWGDNGEERIGVSSGLALHPSPTEVTALSAAPTDLALGTNYTCALVSDRVFCWGANDVGQLGNGTTAMEQPTPTEVTGLGGTPVQIAAYSTHTCARLSSGHVECWGENGNGELGVGDTTDRASPTRVPGIDDAVQIATGSTHTCALRASGVVECWGLNTSGELGDGTEVSHNTPAPVMSLPDAVLQIALGSAHTCARTASEVFCWGNNFFGQTGHDIIDSYLTTPQPTGLGAVGEVAAGGWHTCVRVAGTTVRCFGRDEVGQLGRGTTGGADWMPMEVAWP